MEFAEKKAAYDKLMGEQHLDDDVKLLTKKNPESHFLKVPIVDKKQAQSDILWDLLEHASEEEVVKNRKPVKKIQAPKETAEQKAERIAKEKADDKVQAVKELLETDLEKAPQKVLAKFARTIPEIAEAANDFRGDTLRPLLVAFAEKITPQGKTNLPPVAETKKEKPEPETRSMKPSTDNPEKKSE